MFCALIILKCTPKDRVKNDSATFYGLGSKKLYEIKWNNINIPHIYIKVSWRFTILLIGWDRTLACKGTSGCHYQSIFDLTHPPNPCMERQTTTPRTAFPTLWQFVLIGPCLTSQTTGSCGYLRHPDKFSFICYAKRYQLSLFSGYKNHITLIAGCL